MKTILSLASALHRDEEGAAFIEYTALLGVILAVGLVVLTKVGNWATSSVVYALFRPRYQVPLTESVRF